VSDTPDLFDYEPPRKPPRRTGQNWRNTDPETSREAAQHPFADRDKDRWLVLRTHYENSLGLTDFELAAILSRQQTSVGKRRGELRDNGFIEATPGPGGKRPAPSGSNAIVWRITEKGRFVARGMWPQS
jgi:hypothetical protein